MPLRPNTLALTALLAALTALGPLSTDMYLPSLPAIGRYFGRSIAEVQMTLSGFLIGFAVGQVFYGPLADRHGRKPVLLAGLGLFTAATIACGFAPNLDTLIVARFCQALGASGPIVLARSIVRDLYMHERAARELARMGMIMGLVPAVAPVVGGVLEVEFGWRASFIATTLATLVLIAAVLAALPETLRTRAPEPVGLRRIVSVFAALWRERGYRSYVMLACCAYGGLFAFISGSSFVFQGVYRLTPGTFGVAFASCVVGYVTGTILAQRLVGRLGIEGTIGLGVLFLAGGGAAMLLAMLVGPGHFLEAVLPMIVYLVGLGLTLPQTMAGAMMPFPDRAGAASSLLGLFQMGFAAAVGIALSFALGGAAWPLGLAVASLGTAALAIFHLTGAARRTALAQATR